MNNFTILTLSISLFFLAACAPEPTTPENALQHYLKNKDKSFSWELVESFESGSATAYTIHLTSQQWREIIWTHQLTVIVPPVVNHSGALLFITGGSNTDGKPNFKKHDHETIQMMTPIAEKNHAIVAVLYQVPNQPLFGDLTEDEIISYTLHNYRQDKDLTWPLLFPMVKSAVRAMDVVQAFAKKELAKTVDKFVVSGASKRGWTTWLTGANDPRVVAICPMVIDVLNMPVQMDYQIAVWQDYSPQIEDYVKLEIPQAVSTPEGQELVTMIDPYSYREKLTMPKMIFIGTNDEYWPVDAVKHYINDIPGDNFIHYTANAGHGLGDGEEALKTLSAFFAETLEGVKHPVCSWGISEQGNGLLLLVDVEDMAMHRAVLWTAESKDRDFRDAVWLSTQVAGEGAPEVHVPVDYPAQGYKAFYVDVFYEHPNGGEYAKSTRMFVADAKELFVN
ncbi:PhoPQ-activated pathogenicity-like protein PqaA type [candidate division KSB1 bacterium]|nr:PhoPQ-activated pathogenicity-like protein PqaA type [candidate division KSB1 bacterium]RQW07402.1 MAG: PhoPQ-activated pathogenicity-like protein PqaA type [candidate division KSB1 bacterium]